eukprot:c54903_g1_i1.p2 GENE.c54903_g1_i1~~c54903_g1_i1.p2  ORF type:complete len:167 (-),score=41.54 c54903_g1_i1:41-511(-)
MADVDPTHERTFIAIKPDGVARGLVGEVIKRFEAKGFSLVGMKLMHVTKEFAAQHYDDLKTKKFFDGLCTYLSSGPVVAMVWQGFNVVRGGRALVGATNPVDSLPGSIRGDFAQHVGRNIIHGSDAVESAQHEIALWFTPAELMAAEPLAKKWLFE